MYESEWISKWDLYIYLEQLYTLLKIHSDSYILIENKICCVWVCAISNFYGTSTGIGSK